MAVFNHDRTSSRFSGLPISLYCSSSDRSTYKISARDYQTYDPSFYRTAGIAGVTDTSTAEQQYLYSDLPHGSQFTFDITFANRPSLLSLLAVRNMNVTGVYWRFNTASSFDNSNYWRSYSFTNSLTGDGPNFYSGNYDGQKVSCPFVSIRSYGTISISSVTYTLVMVSIDWSITGANHMAFEAPWYQLYPTGDPASVGGCSAYLLDEWVTIHKPVNA